MTEAAYTAKDITVLEGLEPVRLRPGMYIGSTGPRGLHHLVYEVVANSVDEAMAGRADRIEVILHPDNSVTISDNGSGIPVDVMAEQGLPALTVVLTKLHAGGKFGGDGLQGLRRPARRRRLRRQRAVGVARRRGRSATGRSGARSSRAASRSGDMKAIGPTKDDRHDDQFLPDLEIFDELEWSARDARPALRETAFLTRGLRIVLVDERGRRDATSSTTRAASGTSSPTSTRRRTRSTSTSSTSRARPIAGTVEVAMQWNASYVESVFSFANNINTHEGGSHLSGFKAALTRHAQQVRARQGPAEGEGGEPRGRGRARGARGGDLGEAPRPAVRGADEDEAREPVGARLRRADGQPAPRRVPRGEPDRRAADRPEGDRGRARAAGGAQGARADARKTRARRRLTSGQARRLPERRPGGRPSSTSSRATPPAARPRTHATVPTRRSCRCAAR